MVSKNRKRTESPAVFLLHLRDLQRDDGDDVCRRDRRVRGKSGINAYEKAPAEPVLFCDTSRSDHEWVG